MAQAAGLYHKHPCSATWQTTSLSKPFQAPGGPCRAVWIPLPLPPSLLVFQTDPPLMPGLHTLLAPLPLFKMSPSHLSTWSWASNKVQVKSCLFLEALPDFHPELNDFFPIPDDPFGRHVRTNHGRCALGLTVHVCYSTRESWGLWGLSLLSAILPKHYFPFEQVLSPLGEDSVSFKIFHQCNTAS